MMTAVAAQESWIRKQWILLVIRSAAATLKHDLHFFNNITLCTVGIRIIKLSRVKIAFLCEWAEVSALTVGAKHWSPAVVQSLSLSVAPGCSQSLFKKQQINFLSSRVINMKPFKYLQGSDSHWLNSRLTKITLFFVWGWGTSHR